MGSEMCIRDRVYLLRHLSRNPRWASRNAPNLSGAIVQVAQPYNITSITSVLRRLILVVRSMYWLSYTALLYLWKHAQAWPMRLWI